MNSLDNLNARIRDRLTPEWLTPSESAIWDLIQRYDGPPHRVINIYGGEGTGKTFLGWFMERQGYASYSLWSEPPQPTLPRLVLDDGIAERDATRNIRPWIDRLGIRQIILMTRFRVDEAAMPAFEIKVTDDDLAVCRANVSRHLRLLVPEETQRNYKTLLNTIG
jgi:predicted ATPase